MPVAVIVCAVEQLVPCLSSGACGSLEQEVLRQKARADRFKDQLPSASTATAKGGASSDFEAKKKVTGCRIVPAGAEDAQEYAYKSSWCLWNGAGKGGEVCCKEMTSIDDAKVAYQSL